MDVADRACYLDGVVTLRHILLAVGGLVVIAAAIYLAIEVRATPASAQVATRSQPSPARSTADDVEEPAAPAPSAGSGSIARTMRSPASQFSKGPATAAGTAPAPSIAGSAAEPMDEAKLKQVVIDAYAAYDRQEFEEAKAIAARALSHDPKNVRALRIMVSTSCIEGNAVEAQKYFDQLPEGKDRADMRTRCGRDYNITFK